MKLWVINGKLFWKNGNIIERISCAKPNFNKNVSYLQFQEPSNWNTIGVIKKRKRQSYQQIAKRFKVCILYQAEMGSLYLHYLKKKNSNNNLAEKVTTSFLAVWLPGMKNRLSSSNYTSRNINYIFSFASPSLSSTWYFLLSLQAKCARLIFCQTSSWLMGRKFTTSLFFPWAQI